MMVAINQEALDAAEQAVKRVCCITGWRLEDLAAEICGSVQPIYRNLYSPDLKPTPIPAPAGT